MLAGQLDRMTAYYQSVYKLSSPGRAHAERQLGAPDADAEPGAEPPLTQAEAGRQRRRMTSLPPTTTAPPGYVLVHKNKLVGPATLRDAIAASGAEDGVYLFTESRYARALCTVHCALCTVQAHGMRTACTLHVHCMYTARALHCIFQVAVLQA